MEQELSRFFYFLHLVWKNKKFIMAFNISIVIVTIIISLLLPKWYKSDATIYIKSDEENSLFGASMLQGLPLSIGSTQSETILMLNQALVSSRSFMDKIIYKFDLDNVYNTKFREDTYKKLSNNLVFRDNEDRTFTIIGYYKENPQIAADMVNYTVSILKELNIEINQKSAAEYREFIEKSYNDSKKHLFRLEDSLRNFQVKTGIVQLEDQVRVLIEQLSEFEAQKIQLELERDFLKKNYSKKSKQVKALNNHIAVLQAKINDLKRSNRYTNIPFEKIADEGLQYVRIYREVMIGEKLLEILLPQLEKSKIDEHKNVTDLIVIDNAVPSEKKTKPKRAVIVITSTFFGFLFSLIFIYLRQFFNDNINNLRKVFKY